MGDDQAPLNACDSDIVEGQPGRVRRDDNTHVRSTERVSYMYEIYCRDTGFDTCERWEEERC